MKTMNKEVFAKMISGREYPLTMNDEELQIAKDSGLVIVFGSSDDSMLFEGALFEEVGAYRGGSAIVVKKGEKFSYTDIDNEDKTITETAKELMIFEVEEDHKGQKNRVDAVWCPEDQELSFLIKTKIPHAIFTITEGEDIYCQGLVFNIKDLE